MVTADEVRFWVDELDGEALRVAQEEFTRKVGAEMEENCLRLLKEVEKRRRSMCGGERPLPFGAFDRDEIERVLAADMDLGYDGYEIDFDADLEKCTDCNDAIFRSMKTVPSEEAWMRFEFVLEYGRYLETAAIYAKSIGAVPAMRLYLRAFLILEPLDSGDRLPPEKAKRVSAFERIATEMLLVDHLGSKLPPFKRAKKSGKTAKRKGGGK